jgi:hypothetical protein
MSGEVERLDAAPMAVRAVPVGERLESGPARLIAFPARRDDAGRPWEAWVDERAVARHFGASERTIRRWRALGMPSRLFAGLRRYRISECEAWHAGERRAS